MTMLATEGPLLPGAPALCGGAPCGGALTCGAGQHSVPQQISDPILQFHVTVFGRDPSLN